MAKDKDGFRIYPSPQVIRYLEQLVKGGELGKTVPSVAVTLIGERILQLRTDGILKQPDDGKEKS